MAEIGLPAGAGDSQFARPRMDLRGCATAIGITQPLASKMHRMRQWRCSISASTLTSNLNIGRLWQAGKGTPDWYLCRAELRPSQVGEVEHIQLLHLDEIRASDGATFREPGFNPLTLGASAARTDYPSPGIVLGSKQDLQSYPQQRQQA